MVAGCDLPGRPDPAGRPVPADEVVQFDALYGQNCSGCHGADGALGPAPPLNDPLFLAIVPDAELLRVVREGRPGTPMPAFAQARGGPLTDAQILVLAGEIKSRWGKQEKAAGAQPPPYLAGGRGDVKRGEKVFLRACAVCHGAGGKEPPLRINDPAFLALISDQALRRVVITGRPDLGMPDWAGPRSKGDTDFKPLTAAEVTDVVALLSSWAPERPGRGRGKERQPTAQQ
jgi:cytochrome c oxidase cbb3-type subunit 3/ubiquinol-cytochrome c reductase cytochrome c subunit